MKVLLMVVLGLLGLLLYISIRFLWRITRQVEHGHRMFWSGLTAIIGIISGGALYAVAAPTVVALLAIVTLVALLILTHDLFARSERLFAPKS